MSAAQKKVIDDHCTTEWAGKVGGPWADFEHAGIAKIKAMPGHEVYHDHAPSSSASGRSRPSRWSSTWADDVKKAGGDPDAVMKELQGRRWRSTRRRIDRPDERRRRSAAAGLIRRRSPDAVDCHATVGASRVSATAARVPRNLMDRFIDAIELIAAIFVGIVAADIFISVLLRYFFSVQIPDSLRFRPAAARHPDLLGHRRDLLSRHPHHRRSGLGQRRPALAARHRRVRHAGAAVRRHGADLHAVRQGRRAPTTPTC